MTPDDLTPATFARLTAIEQSLALLRRAQFLDSSSRIRHAGALDRHQDSLDAHAATLTHLEALEARQSELQEKMLALQDRLATRQDDHAQRLAQHDAVMVRLQLILDAVLEMLRHRNGH